MRFHSTAWFLCLVAIFAASSAAQEDPTAIYVMKSDGSGARQVVAVAGHIDHACPRWSHDGQRLVFHARAGQGGQRACFVVNVDGSGLAELCKGRVPDWSPDDKQIVYQTDAQSAIFVQNLDGKGRVEIAAGRGPRWSPNGGRLALTDRRMLRATDLVTGEDTALLDGPQHEVFDGFAWSPDGQQIAVVTRPVAKGARHLYLVDPAGEPKKLKPRLENGMGGFVSFSPDGQQLVFSDSWQIQVIDVIGNGKPRKLPNQAGKNSNPEFSPDGEWIAFVSSRTDLPAPPQAVPQTPSGCQLEEFKRHQKGTIVYSLDFTPDGQRLVLGCDPKNKGVQVWSLETGETNDLPSNGIRVCQFPDGRRFATSWHSPLVHVVDVDSGEVLRELDHGAQVWTLDVSKDGRRLVTGGLDHVMRVWDPDTGELLQSHENLHQDWITRVRFSPDGREAMTIGHDQRLQVWDVETGKVRLSIKHPAAVWALDVTPDGRYILTGTGGSLQSSLTVLRIGPATDSVVRVWDASTGQLVRELSGHTDTVYTIDVSPDGRLAASGSWDGTLRLWDLATGKELDKTEPRKGRVPVVAFSPNGQLIAVGGGGTRIAGKIVEIPEEQVRLYRVVQQAAASGRSGL